MKRTPRQPNAANRSNAVSAEPEEMVLLTVAQAAQKTQIGPRKLRDMANAGKIPSKRFGRAIRFYPKDLGL